MKTNGLDRTKRLSRIPIQAAAVLPTIDYIFLDYQLFRNGLTGYQIRISTMVMELNLDKKTVIRLCKKYLGLGILNQDEGKNQHKRLYHLNYKACESFIYSLIDGVKLVEPVPQTGGTIPPTLVEPVPQKLVEPVPHTSIRKEFIKKLIKEGQITEPVEVLQPEISKPVTLEKETSAVTLKVEDKINPTISGNPDWVKELQGELKENCVSSYRSYTETIKSRYN